MQLVAYGAQDIYLTGNPQITFFKVVYRRHTNFSMETIQQTIKGTPASAGSSTVTISRNGDLVYKIYVTSESTAADITNGSAIISEVELEIGGQRIDRHYRAWMDVWNELSTPQSKAHGLQCMQGDFGTSGTSSVDGVGTVQIPLLFWFCRNPGLALPLIALQYHEVKLKFTWGANADCGGGIEESQVWCDYIYLDTDERRRFAQVSHEYLIEQVQRDVKTTNTTHKLNFNHPVKELIWTTGGNEYAKANLKLNGHDRFALQDSEYFQLRQPYEYHTAIPQQNLSTAKLLSHNKLVVKATNIITTGASLATEANVSDNANVSTGKFMIADIASFAGSGIIGQPVFAAYDAGTTATGTGFLGSQGIFILNANVDIEQFIPGHLYKVTFDSSGVDAAISLLETEITTHLIYKALGVNESGDTIGTASTGLIFDKLFRRGATATGVDDVKISKIQRYHHDTEQHTQARTSQMSDKINVYSFGLKPEEHQPSGTCNFSRIDTAQLIFSTTDTCTVYAVNYSVLRIMSGMGGLAYSN